MRAAPSLLFSLTRQQRRALGHRARGLTQAQSAELMGLSRGAVKYHRWAAGENLRLQVAEMVGEMIMKTATDIAGALVAEDPGLSE